MLSPDGLKDALHDGVKGAEKCSRFCTYDIRIDDGRYVVHHNGLGNRDSDWQVIYAPGILGLSKDGLAAKLKAWVAGLHTGVRLDLNAALQADTHGAMRTVMPGEFHTPTSGVPIFDGMLAESEAPWVDPAVWQRWQSGPALTGWPWQRVFDEAAGIANWVPVAVQEGPCTD